MGEWHKKMLDLYFERHETERKINSLINKEMTKPKKKKYIYKSAVDGKIVSKEFANDNPTTTYREDITHDHKDEPQLPKLEDGWNYYKRKGLSEMKAYNPDEAFDESVSISTEDKEAGSPKLGDMIARNPKNHNDKWLVAKKYFEDNLELHE